MRGITGYRLSDVMNGALAQLIPQRVPAAGEGGSTLAFFTGRVEDEPLVYSELVVGTWGGRPVADGNDGLANPCASMANIPVELAESDWPIMIERYGLIPDSGGAGRYRGGLAVERIWRVLVPDTAVHVRSDRQVHRPYGLAGGLEGAASSSRARSARTGGCAGCRRCSSRSSSQPGDVLHHRMPGGGGYGDPSEREPEAVAQDVLDEKVSVAAARELYGVVDRGGRLGRHGGHRGAPAREGCPVTAPGSLALRIRGRRPRRGSCSASSRPSRMPARSGGRSPSSAPAPTTSRSTTRSRPPLAGEVIVLATGGERQVAHCGEIIAIAALERGVAGIVLDGAIRDRSGDRRARPAGLLPRHLAARPGEGRARAPSAVPVELRRRRDRAGRPRLRRRRRGRRSSRPPTHAEAVEAAVAALEAKRGRESSPRSRRGRDDRRHLRAEGARMRITARRGDAARDPARAGVPLGRRRAGRREPRPLHGAHRRGRDGVRRVGLRGPRAAVVSYGQLMARQLVGRSPGRHGGDPALDLDARGAGRCSPQFTQLIVRRASRSPAGTRSAARSACRRARSSAAGSRTSSTTSASSRATTRTRSPRTPASSPARDTR